MVKRLIGIEEAATYLGIKKATLYSWASKRSVPSVKMGRRLLFDLKDLDELVDLRRRGASDTIQAALSDITPKRR